MNNKVNHYASVLLFAAGLGCLTVFVFTMSTFAIIGAFLGLLFSMMYRSEYQFNVLMRYL